MAACFVTRGTAPRSINGSNYCDFLYNFISVGTMRGQGTIRVVVVLVTFFDILIFWKIFKVNKAQIIYGAQWLINLEIPVLIRSLKSSNLGLG